MVPIYAGFFCSGRAWLVKGLLLLIGPIISSGSFAQDGRSFADYSDRPIWMKKIYNKIDKLDFQNTDDGKNYVMRKWVGARGNSIGVRINLPNIGSEPNIVVECDPTEDATGKFEEILSKNKTGRVVVNSGPCYFRSTLDKFKAHLLFRGAHDLVFDGGGNKLIFEKDSIGIEIQSSNRIELRNFSISYSFPTSSVFRAKKSGESGEVELVSESELDSDNANLSIFQLTELESSGLRWIRGGQRLIIPPTQQSLIKKNRHGLYRSDLFKYLKDGTRYFAVHHWYGGQAIHLGEQTGVESNQDITISSVVIENSPGAAVNIESLDRGFLFRNNLIKPGSNNRSIGSSSWDAIHFTQSGSDIYIYDNEITGTGDDAINISNPVHRIVSIDLTQKNLTLSKYSLYVRQGDSLLFFGDSGQFLGSAIVNDVVERRSLHEAVFGVQEFPVSIKEAKSVRVERLIASRFVVERNYIHDCNCHALLAQIPGGLVFDNKIADINFNAIRLTTDISRWYEGVGAIDVVVDNNSIVRTGVDRDLSKNWAVISVYGGFLGAGYVNEYIEISRNVISGYRQGCILIHDTARVKVKSNSC